MPVLIAAPPPPQASDRARELERMYQMRRGHAPQISISDDSHHVTEAIGDMYGGDSDNESSRRSSRPLSFVPSPNGDSIQSLGAFEPFDPFPASPPAKSPLRSQVPPSTASSSSSYAVTQPAVSTSPKNTASVNIPQKRTSFSNGTPMSPPLSRSNSDTASQQFPLNDLDYESSPAGLAQELSNLQAIRRMSMGVNNADPDLPSFKSTNGPPSPPATSDEEDPSKLFWVPARLHPELAPKEFKTFIEEKVNTIRRRSGDSDSLSPDGAFGGSGSGGLRRKKSMLSRQIDSGSGYKDGAERLERKRSGHQPNGGLANLQELEHIVEDPVELVRRMSLSQNAAAIDGEAGADGDGAIGPSKFGGMGTLKRSTRTTYRRGSLRKGGPPLSRRLMSRQAETDTEDSPSTSPVYSATEPDVPPLPITRVQSEPVNGQFEGPSNFSRPRRRSPPSAEPRPGSAEESRPPSQEQQNRPQQKVFHSRIASNGRTSAHLPGYDKAPTLPPVSQQVPQIIETPPQPQDQDRRSPYQLPERHSSRQPPPQAQQQQQPNGPRNYSQQYNQNQQRQTPQTRPNRHQQASQASPIKPAQSFDDLVQHPSPIPGNSTRTDSLSIIPNLPEEKKSDKKSKDKKDEGSRKTSWGWLVGGDKEKEREKKEKEEREREKELAKKVKNKLSKTQEKGHDDTRLDVLQTSLQGSNTRGRESVVLDRDSIKLEEERKKESNRKSSSDGKKEKEPGLLSSIFGGGKKKTEKDPSHKKSSTRGLSPEPPPRILKPDIDYNWTRFSILEERAIYRMAHIKLANPRRELYSQVLLSNFMYSYLAKVQQMHPQIQIGNSKQAKQAQEAQQRQQQAAQQKKEQQAQPEEFAQYQRYQQQQQEQPEASNEWPSAQQQQQQQQNHAGGKASQDNGQYAQQPNAYNQNPRDSHHSQHSANGGGYSVANSQNYLGQSNKKGYAHYSDSDQSNRADDDMW